MCVCWLRQQLPVCFDFVHLARCFGARIPEMLIVVDVLNRYSVGEYVTGCIAPSHGARQQPVHCAKIHGTTSFN